jgi:hypothetical protein
VDTVKISIFEINFFDSYSKLILRIIYFATLGDKMENKLEKAYFT